MDALSIDGFGLRELEYFISVTHCTLKYKK